jgi:transcriptional regulator with XRE-family HTH domain
MESDGRLREARRARRLTQRQLAAEAGLTTETISVLERTTRAPTYPTAQAIARALGMPQDELFARIAHSEPHPDDPVVRTARYQRRLTQRQVASETGLKLGVVQRAEAGARVTLEHASALAQFFGLDLSTVPHVEEPAMSGAP